MAKLKKDKTKAKAKAAPKAKAKTKVKAKAKAAPKPKAATKVKAKTKVKAAPKAKKEVKRAGASAGRNASLAFNISGVSPKLVVALDKAAEVKAKKDGHRVSRSRLINSVLEKKFL